MKNLSWFVWSALYFFSLILVGCDKSDDPADNSGIKNAVVVRNDSIIVTGGSDFEFDAPFPSFSTERYLTVMKERESGNVSKVTITAISSGIAVNWFEFGTNMRSSGWYEESEILQYVYADEVYHWKIKASGEYRMVFRPLPLSDTPDNPPVTYVSKGHYIYGPVALSGSVSFAVSCHDAAQSGFTVLLLNASTGNLGLTSSSDPILRADNVNKSNSTLINNFSKTYTCSNIPAGNYFVEFNSNINAEVTVSIN
jgi:hypothetical protein